RPPADISTSGVETWISWAASGICDGESCAIAVARATTPRASAIPARRRTRRTSARMPGGGGDGSLELGREDLGIGGREPAGVVDAHVSRGATVAGRERGHERNEGRQPLLALAAVHDQ